jgi:hypothetical protein
MRRFAVSFAFLLLLSFVLAAGGCSSSSSTKMRVMNAVPNEASLDALLDTASFATNIAYGNSSAYASTSSGSRNLQVEPSGTTDVIINTTLSVSSGASYTVVAANFSSQAAAITLTDDNSSPVSGNFKIRIVNAAPGLGTADVYIVAPGTDLTSATPSVSSLAFESGSAYQSLAAGTYEVFFTLPGQKVTYIDSGPLSLNAGQVRTLVSLDSQSGGFTTSVLADLN